MSERITIIGGGLMGTGIAQVFACAGHIVCVFEPSDDVRTAIPDKLHANMTSIGMDLSFAGNVHTTSDLNIAVQNADIIIEAAPEKLELKRSIFAQLVSAAPARAIIATNTSVIPVTQIVEGLATAERICGTHWWNPAYLVPLVEVVQAEKTAPETIERMMSLLVRVGKTPAHVQKDVPGFIANRLQHALWREAIAMVAEGICDARTLDTCVKSSFGLRLPVLGPLENADLVGLDLTLDIHETMIPELDRSAGPHAYLREKVSAGHLGFKSGRGFSDWTPEQMTTLRQRLAAHLVAATKTIAQQ